MTITSNPSATGAAAASAAPATPAAPAPPATNHTGHAMAAYKGAPSTLCAGCGHDSITSQLIRSLFEMGVDPYGVAKMSGIGCSSKTTTYFLGQSHGINGVHGRMAAMATGAHLANHKLLLVGVSGDGDTASIGLGHFLHMLRRNVPMIYVLENNGVYGLTKGQFSATADKGSAHKKGFANQMPPIDCCALAIEMGCDFVARSFSGDVKQLSALLKAAVAHRGTAFLDVVSPCVTFNNHEGSTKSLKHARAHEEPLHELGFVPHFNPVHADYEPGTTQEVPLSDGSVLVLKKLAREYDPADRDAAMALLHEASDRREFLTGLIYHDADPTLAFGQQLNLVDMPLAHLPETQTRPGPDVMRRIMDALR